MTALKERIAALLDWWKHTRIGRGLARYGAANGALLSGGIAYSALFSIVAALTIAFTVFAAALGSNEELRTSVLASLDQALPGIVATSADDGGLLTPEQLRFSGGTGITGVIAVIVLVNSATSVMAALRTAIRAMFGIIAPRENIAIAKLRDLGGFVGLALSVLLTSVLGIAAGAAGSWVLAVLRLDGSEAGAWLLQGLGLLVVLAVDWVVFLLLFRVLAGVKPPRRDLFLGALVAALGAGAIRFLGTSIVSRVDNPLLASFAALVTLLLWVNLAVRLTLMAAAWTANPPAPPVVTKDMVTHLEKSPNYVTLSEPETLTWDHDPVTGKIRPHRPEPEEYWGGLIGWCRRAWRRVREE